MYIYVYIHMYIIFGAIYVSIYLSISLSLYLSIYLSIYIYMYIHMICLLISIRWCMCGAWKASHSWAHKSQTFDFGSAAPNTMLATKPEAIHHDSHIDISRQAESHNEPPTRKTKPVPVPDITTSPDLIFEFVIQHRRSTYKGLGRRNEGLGFSVLPGLSHQVVDSDGGGYF